MIQDRAIQELLPPKFVLLLYTQIASLWSNYGHIYRVHVKSTDSSAPKVFILKSIHPPQLPNPSESHIRKLLSYEVERWFYHHYAARLPATVKVAKAYISTADSDGNLLLEDLSADYAFPARGSLGKDATTCVLRWLAGFHATFFRVHRDERVSLVPSPSSWKNEQVEGVWRRGVYWYLETRREELEEMDADDHAWLLPWIEKVSKLSTVSSFASDDAACRST